MRNCDDFLDINDINKTSIPTQYVDKMYTLLKNMEEETGMTYKITIHPFGYASNFDTTFSRSDVENHKIEVYDVDPLYKELDGYNKI